MADWLGVCTKFAETLAKSDPVLSNWRERLQVFEKGMPLLLQLASKYLKVIIVVFEAQIEESDYFMAKATKQQKML